MCDFLTSEINRLFLSEKIVVTSVQQTGDNFEIEFIPASEVPQKAIEKRPDLQKATEEIKSKGEKK